MFSIRRHPLFKLEIPDPTKYIGRYVRVMGTNGLPRVVECERIVGNLMHPTKYEVTAKGVNYLISMLDFHAQMEGEKVSQADIDEFDKMTMEYIHRVEQPGKDKLWVPEHLRNRKPN